jgi:tetratricopeptide (TPR) repeat protein
LTGEASFPYKSLMIMSAEKRRAVTVVTLVLLVALIGCVSTEKRYKKGQQLESQGRLEEAAQRYIAVLAKEPGREDARQRLAEVGAKVVGDYLDGARDNEADGYFENAVAAILRIDGLRARTEQVGVPIPVPAGYADFRLEMVDAAVRSLFRQGEDLERAGRWPDALRRYETMLPYPLDPDERLRVDDARARVFLQWAGQDMETGSFRAAYQHAQNARDIYGPDSPAGAEGRTIQKAALDAGTRTVAVLPFWAEPRAADRAPRGLEGRLYDSLLYEHMDKPPLFVGPIDRGAIHREMTRLRVRSGEIPLQIAITVGQALRADFVVVGWLESYAQEDGVPEEIARKAPLRRDRAKYDAYTEKRYTAKLTGEAICQIVDRVARKVVEEQPVAASVSAPFRRAHYDGDYTALDLSRDERALFDKEGWLKAEEELQAKLVGELAKKIAACVFDRVLRHVR